MIEFFTPAETNISAKEEEKRSKYQELRKLYPDYSVKLFILLIRYLGGARHTLLLSLEIISACCEAADRVATPIQKVVIFGL